MDGKGRVSLPSQYRQVLSELGGSDGGDSFIIVPRPGLDPCHVGFSILAHQRLVARIGRMQFGSAAHRDETRRRYIAEAVMVTMEEGGRFVLPRDLRDPLDLGAEVQFVADADTFQIWNPETYAAEQAAKAAAAPFEPLDLTELVGE